MSNGYRAFLPDGKLGDPVEEAKAMIAAAVAERDQAQTLVALLARIAVALEASAVALEASVPKGPQP